MVDDVVTESASRREQDTRRWVIDGVAAVAVGIAFTSAGWPLIAWSGLMEMLPGGLPQRYAAFAPAVLAVAVALVGTLARLGGWLVAAIGLAVTVVATQLPIPGILGSLAFDDSLACASAFDGSLACASAGMLLAAGVGFALGGAVLVAAHATAPARLGIAGGLAAGMLLGPFTTELVTAVLGPDPAAVISPTTLPLGTATVVVATAAVLTRGRERAQSPAIVRTGLGPVLVVALLAILPVIGGVLRRVIIREVGPGPDGLEGLPRREAVELLSRYSMIAIAVVVAVVLTLYAYHRGRAPAARWVVLGFTVGGVTIGWLPVVVAYRPIDAVLAGVVAVLAAIVGTGLARYADRLLPWDVLGVCVAVGGMMLKTEVMGQEYDWTVTAHALLVALGLPLALSFGFARALLHADAAQPETPPPGTADRAGTLTLGVAALVLAAQTLAPMALDAWASHSDGAPRVTIPVVAATGAAALLMFFGWAMRRSVPRPTPAPEPT
ncbi:hypothetical protein [Micromonospora sp. NPDC049679]|uniref:hypothetical protein n=1 Tax=Micromonospora sp. NPDC049679 TaxID=3155920 RepID=UPI0033EED073